MLNFKDMTDQERTFIKRVIIGFFSLISVLLVIIGVFFIAIIRETLHGDATERSQIAVNGEGKVFIRPDIATFMATVVTDAMHVGDAQNQNATRSNAVIDFLKKNSIKDKDIKTINYSVQPQYRYDRVPCPTISPLSIPCSPVNNIPRIVSYQVRSSLQIKVRDLNKVDDLLQGVVSAGANEVGSVAFTVEDEKAAMTEARKQAIDDAQAKARVLARDLGVRLKKIIGFSESGGVPVYYGGAFEAKSTLGGSAPAPQVEPGEQEIRSQVTVTYEFR